MKKYFIGFILVSKLITAQQVGGKSTFSFLNTPVNARVAGLGGEIVSQRTDDPNLIRYNPAAANYSMNKTASINFMNFFSGVYLANTNFAYAKDSTKIMWAGNLNYLDFGTIDSFDDGGNPIGTFKAKEFAVTASAAKRIKNYSLGVNLGFANSNIASYNAYSIYMDLGGQFIHPSKPITIGLLIKNIGFNINNYIKNNNESLPIDIQTGATFKPQHMPIRFNFTLHKLYRYNVSYYDPKSKIYIDQQIEQSNKKPNVIDKTLRHIDIGIEGILSKGFNIRAGYSFMRRQDLKFQTSTSAWAGFSLGAMIRIKKLSVEYTQVFYHSAGSKGIISLSKKF